MKTLFLKEIRSLAPVWGVAMVLAIFPVWLRWPGQQGGLLDQLSVDTAVVFAPFGLGVLLLSLAPFGQELNWGTFSVLLAQPVARQRVWRAKTVVLALALVLTFLALYISNHIRVESLLEGMKQTVWRNAFNRPGEQSRFFVNVAAEARNAAARDTLLIGGLEVLAAFAGGLWTTLFFRQVPAAFWLALTVPLALTVITGKALENFPDQIVGAGLAFVLGSYSIGGFLWAKRFFLHVQDTQWTGGVIALPQWRNAARASTMVNARTFKPMRSLLSKELQAQHVNLLLAGGLLLLHLAVIAVRAFSTEYLATHRSVAMVLEEVPFLWLVLPLLVGSVAVAEERKLGTLQPCLCLPVSRRTQLVIKLVVAMALGIVFGGIVPVFLERLSSSAQPMAQRGGLLFLNAILPNIGFQLVSSAGLTLLAAYCSTMTRNTLQAIGASLVGAIIAYLLIAGALLLSTGVGVQAWNSPGLNFWSVPLARLVGLPILLTTLFVLACRNYRQLLPDSKVWLKNVVTLLVALICIGSLTTTIYHRVWEIWLPEEPAHGPIVYPIVGQPAVRFGQAPAVTPKIRSSSFRLAVILPDGRLWLRQQNMHLLYNRKLGQGAVSWQTLGPSHTGIIASSNWKDIAVTYESTFGIRNDGSLWDLSAIEHGEFRPKQVGQSLDWASLSARGWHVCALKSDGTLWEWGDAPAQSSSAPTSTAPVQIGTDNDWVAVCDTWAHCAAVKSDGSIWKWAPNRWDAPSGRITALRSVPVQWLIGPPSKPVSLDLEDLCIAAVCEDGTLWLGGNMNSPYMRMIGLDQARAANNEMVRWGRGSDWKEIRFLSWGEAVGIKRDGSLWQWSLGNMFGRRGWVVTPTTPSSYMDWLAVSRKDNAYVALAADGSLCLWGDPEDTRFQQSWNGLDPHRLLMPSRIKARKIADLAP